MLKEYIVQVTKTITQVEYATVNASSQEDAMKIYFSDNIQKESSVVNQEIKFDVFDVQNF